MKTYLAIFSIAAALYLSAAYTRPTLRPLQVVPATVTHYTPEELSEIYPTH